MAKKRLEQKEKLLEPDKINYCYIGENKENVLVICKKEDWEAILDVINWAKKRVSKDYLMAHESDKANYGYTYTEWLNTRHD